MGAENMTAESALARRRLWLSLGWTLVVSIICLSLIPVPVRIPVAEGDKLGHLIAYGALMLWFSNVYENSIPRLILAVGLLALGIALEFIQRWTGFRTFEIADMVANASGVFLGWTLAPPRIANFLQRLETLPLFRKKN